MENTEGWFKPSKGFEKIYIERYDIDENEPDILHYVGPHFSPYSGVPVNDFIEVNTLAPKVKGLIVAYNFDYNSNAYETVEKKYLEQSIMELQDKYPEYIIMVPQLLEARETSYAKGFCIDIDAFSFKPYPYNKFIRWVYPNTCIGEIKDLNHKLSEIRFAHAVSNVDGIIADLEKCESIFTNKVKEFRKYLFDTWF